MPHPDQFEAHVWVLRDLETLARAIADLALGQTEHVEQLLRSTDDWSSASADYAVNGAIRMLSVPPGADPWHRDGWVFQLMSWIAAVEEGDGPTRMPQMDQASKGFDGLQLERSSTTGEIDRAVIFEDKATDSPRDKVRDLVWPSFRIVESGEVNPALAAEIGFLARSLPHVDGQQVVDRIMRDPSGRAYRVSVTSGSYHAQGQEFKGLFDGFEDAVRGDRRRRRGNVFEVAELRPWFDMLCRRAIQLLEEGRV